MIPDNRFNLIDEPWIPIVDIGNVSLKQVFSYPEYRALGGNPIQKIALTKLLLAIAQSSYTPENDEDWSSLQPIGLAHHCLNYLEKWHDRFYLYGDKPFLQIPAINKAAVQNFGAVMPEISSGNTTILTQSQIEKKLTDADKALLILTLMGFGLGGKADNTIVLSSTYQGKQNKKGNPSTCNSGAAIGASGFLHNFLQNNTLHKTLWHNLFTHEQISSLRNYPEGIGKAPWEEMPISEDCHVAQALKSSLIGRLIPVSLFCLLTEIGLHNSEGIAHPGYKEGCFDPSICVNYSSKAPKAIHVDPEKRPWRSLTTLLSFLSELNNQAFGFECQQLHLTLKRMMTHEEKFILWSGGLKISGGVTRKHYISGSDDFIESTIQLHTHDIGETWFSNLQLEMEKLDHLSKIIYSATCAYFKNQKTDGVKQAKAASNLLWQLCERRSQELINGCDDLEKVAALRQAFANFALTAYDSYCPKETARQLDAWAKNRPNLHSYTYREKEST
ncbi:MAG: type I-E CRISPR-associated protein Cse1/CasA [Legionellales bacterium]|nr:type I-E CRISPR-associated protein Cse1/CasA [Legionellales bacterium]